MHSKKLVKRKIGIGVRIDSIRRRGLKAHVTGDIKKSSRESFVRNAVMRMVVLPAAKKAFGKKLCALVFFGSGQLGVRKAAKKDDIDFIAIVQDFHEVNLNPLTRIERPVQKRFGAYLHPHIWGPKRFISKSQDRTYFTSHDFAFQVIFGKDWINANLPAEFLAKRQKYKKDLKDSKRYAGRQ